ncbi:MAG: hypothetical protein QM528_06520 [Phycisphaerales bacterium]|nr:hypothetical protein [Phycisphaerales bacterium]
MKLRSMSLGSSLKRTEIKQVKGGGESTCTTASDCSAAPGCAPYTPFTCEFKLEFTCVNGDCVVYCNNGGSDYKGGC